MTRYLPSRRGFLSALVVVLVGAASAGFFLWVLRTPDAVRSLAVRAVVVSLVLFLIILFVRYFALLWFAYLQHTEENLETVPEDPDLPPVSIVVPAYNEAEVLGEAIESLLALDYPTYEIMVVDDGSTDATLEVATRYEGGAGGVPVTVLTQENAGKAAALNLGIQRARHPFLFCMDADSHLEPDTLRMAAPRFRDPDVGAVAGNVKVENRDSWLTRLQALEYIEGLNLPRRAQGFVAAVNIVPGPVGFFRRSALEEVGYYDTDTYAEDADLTLKLITAGWKIVYEERAVAWTHAPATLLDLIQQRYRWTRGILQALRKRKRVLLTPFPDFPLWLSALEMGFEAIVWPILNIYAHLFFAVVALAFGRGELLLYWWILLTLLDVVAALVTVAMEEESLWLVPYAVIYRFFFILFLDVCKSFASIEELFRVRMDWGKLRRAETATAS